MNISEIAKRANVSRATVSRVINNYPGIKEKTRMAVQAIIDEANYIPSAAARSLSSNKSNIIGVLVYNITQPFWGGIVSAVEEGLSNTNYDVFFANSKNHLNIWDYNSDYKKNLKNLISRGVDGIIIALANDLDAEDVDVLEAANTPFVVIQNYLADDRITSVNVDNFQGAYTATKYMIQLGHRKIAHAAGPLEGGIARERMKGFIQAMKDHGLPVLDENIVRCGFKFNDGYWCMKQLLKRDNAMTAIVFTNDITALGGCLAAREEHTHIPDDLSIIGFDKLVNEMDVASLLPNLTTMEQPVMEIGLTAARILLDKLQNKPSSSVILPLTLYEGETSKNLNLHTVY